MGTETYAGMSCEGDLSIFEQCLRGLGTGAGGSDTSVNLQLSCRSLYKLVQACASQKK